MAAIKKTPRLLDELATAIATGVTVRAWAKHKGIPERTAYDWARMPGVREQVAQIRRRFIDATVGKLVTLARKATRELDKLLDPKVTETVRLGAIRTVLSNLVDISSWADYEARLAAIERRLDASTTDRKTEEA
jgi:hypothetical protein